MANLGIKKKDLDNLPSIAIAAGKEDDGDDLKYPSFSLRNKHIEAAGLEDVNAGDVIEFTVKAKVSAKNAIAKGSSKSYDSDRVELEVQDISDVTKVESGEEPEESDEDKDFKGRMGFASKGVSKGNGSLSPKSAGVKLK